MVAPRELIPPHKILSDNEAKKVSKEFGIPFEKFPKIYENDPQVVKLGAKAGQMIEIDRQESNNKYKYYRYVVTG